MNKTIKDILTDLACENFNRGTLNDDSRVDESVDQALSGIQELIDGAKPPKSLLRESNIIIKMYQDNLQKLIGLK